MTPAGSVQEAFWRFYVVPFLVMWAVFTAGLWAVTRRWARG